MSAVPEDFMRNPEEKAGHEAGRETGESRPPADEAGATALWQWLAIGVLVVCWLAEASLCAARAP